MAGEGAHAVGERGGGAFKPAAGRPVGGGTSDGWHARLANARSGLGEYATSAPCASTGVRTPAEGEPLNILEFSTLVWLGSIAAVPPAPAWLQRAELGG
jgi:hypothetical protein